MGSMKIVCIGGGNMGEAILAAILNRGLSRPGDIRVSDTRPARLEELSGKYGVSITGDNRAAISGMETVILAVKPQNLRELMAEMEGRFQPEQMIISIIAGARIDTLCQGLNHRRVVRVMPNTPAQIGRGISVWTATPEVSAAARERAGAIIGATGREIYFDDEKYLDMATAISGSGPAYFFYFVEALIAAARELGFSPDTARELVLETMLGAGQLIEASGLSPAELRKRVTSPGGTTAAALEKLEQGQFTGLVQAAVVAAYRRATELGNK